MSDKFSKYLMAFCKNHKAQHGLLNMIENWKGNLKKGNKTGAIFLALSKALDTLDHSLLIGKLEAYCFDSLSLKFMTNYLTNRKQSCKVGNGSPCGEKLHQASLKVSCLNPCFLIFS